MGLAPDGFAKVVCWNGLGVGDNDKVDEVSLSTGCTAGVGGQGRADLVSHLPFHWVETIWMSDEARQRDTVRRVRRFDSAEVTCTGYEVDADIVETLRSKEHLEGDPKTVGVGLLVASARSLTSA